ncbi:hypothetical protein M0804_001812 [Polistes exclamans]|nr:hypothetical protein M0804_001812 [Polistes exclamans]
MLLRRHKLSTGFTQNLFGSSFEKSFSTTSIRDADDNNSNKKSGFLSKLKSIFNKSDNISHEVHDKTVNRQSILARSTYLNNKHSKEFKNAIGRKMSNSWNNKLYNFYNPKEYDYYINDSLFNFDPSNHFRMRTKSLICCNTFSRNVNNHVEVKNETSFVPQISRPPIREPNMPEKQEKKDEKKKKEKKKPVVNTYDHFVNRTGHFLKINIGQSTQYVSNLAMTRNATNYSSNMPIHRRYVFSGMNNLLFKETTDLHLSSNSNKTVQNISQSEILSDNSMLSFDKNYLKSDDKVDDLNTIKAELAKDDANAIEEPDWTSDTEISAWRTLVDKSKPPPEKKVEQELVELQLDKVSIRPEPPIPKLDIEMVKPLNNEIRNVEELEDSVSSDRKLMKSTNNIRVGSMIETQKYHNRKYHTLLSNKKEDILAKILISKNFSISHSNSNTDSESTQRSNAQNQQVSKTKVQSDQKAFARSSARESENTDDGTSNESKRSSLSTDFQSGISKHEEKKTSANFTQTFDAVDGERVISLNHSNQGDARLPLSVTISSRPKQEESNVETLDDEMMHTKNYINDDYPYTCFNESYFEETKYADSKHDLNQIDNPTAEEQETMRESNLKELEEEDEKKMEVEVHGNDGFVRIPGDPYPYSREHFNKWRLPRKKTFEDTILKTLQSDQSRKKISEDAGAQSSTIIGSSGTHNPEDSKTSSTQKEKQPNRKISHDSHVNNQLYQATMLGDNIEDRNRTKKVKKIYQPRKLNGRKFSVSSLNHKIIPECLRRGIDDVSRREFHRWIHFDFRNKKNDQFVKIENVLNTPEKGTPGSEETDHHDSQSQSVFNKTKLKDVPKYKVSNLVQEHQFRTATSVKKEKELQTVTRLETEPSMTTEEFKRIYEMKNYSYLKTEEIKDTRPIKMKERKPEIEGLVYVDNDNDNT